MKRLIKKIFRKLGYDIVKYSNDISCEITTERGTLSFYETKTGSYYLPSDATNDFVANAIKHNEIFEKEVVEVAQKYVKENTVVLDLGANYGQMSILFSNMANGKVKVYSFDANDFVFDILKKNIEVNSKKESIMPVFGALHDKQDVVLYFSELDFVKFTSYGSYGIDYNATKGREVMSITIDSMNINEPICLMKIDIQGGDLLAMKGAVKTIEKNKMPIIFEYEYQFEDEYNLSFQEYVDFVNSINYKFAKVINGHNYLILPK